MGGWAAWADQVIRRSGISDEHFGASAARMECWCLHGAVGSASDWRELATQLASSGIGSRAIDLWRFLEDGPLPMPSFTDALNAEVSAQSHPAQSRMLMGYSMGGRLALHALLDRLSPWRAAVIISAHPGLESEKERTDRRVSDQSWAARVVTWEWNDFLNAWNAQPVLAGTSMRDASADSRLAHQRRAIAQSFIDWSLGAQEPLGERLGEIRIPVLWVVGERDPKFIALAERAMKNLPCGRLVVMPGAGHRVPWEATDALSVEIAAFADQVLGK
jgi:2-succinyl-6-hydroxy-2,4-cyclohexadiene-1-carboxylate synthase